MKIAVMVPDPLLGRALLDLLRAEGHEAFAEDLAPEDCALRIVTGEPPPARPGCATLHLERSSPRHGAADPADALRAALASGGRATWSAPLDTHLLVEALRPQREDTPHPAAVVPDLATAPHAWIVTDAGLHRVQAANPEARALLRLDGDGVGTALDALPFGPRLADALREESEGRRATQIAGRTHEAAWWTDERGHRVICFLPVLGQSHRTDRTARALADLGRMAATLAHEIRNPVASLAGALELLEHEQDPEERREILDMAQARLRQLSRLLEKTLTLARPIDGPVEAVDVQAVIASAVATARFDPQFEDVTISVDAPAAPVVAHAYEGPLVQALLNLLLNAAQAQRGRGAVHVTLEIDRGRALLRVHDEGPGIPPEKREEVFRPFYTTRPDGTGLGLAEVRRAIEAFDGEIEILDVEEGTCFQVTLPLARPGP